jgi:hypothetical protein
VVASGGGVLARVAGGPVPAPLPLDDRNTSGDYDVAEVLRLGERLLASPGAWSAFYPAHSLERLLAGCESRVRSQATPGVSTGRRSISGPGDGFAPPRGSA